MKARLVQSQADRTGRIETGDQTVVGVNRFTEGDESPLVTGDQSSILVVDPAVEKALRQDLADWKADRDAEAVRRCLQDLAEAARNGTNIMGPSIELAMAGGTTGEWAGTLREVFGEFRAPTGISRVSKSPTAKLSTLREKSAAMAGGPPRMLVAKPGLDGHSNGAEQIAVAGRDAGFEVIYQGIRLTPEQIAQAARDEDVDVVGISILSGSHLALVPAVIFEIRKAGSDALVVVGGIIPDSDAAALYDAGVTAIYTPKDYELATIMDDIAHLVEIHRKNQG